MKAEAEAEADTWLPLCCWWPLVWPLVADGVCVELVAASPSSTSMSFEFCLSPSLLFSSPPPAAAAIKPAVFSVAPPACSSLSICARYSNLTANPFACLCAILSISSSRLFSPLTVAISAVSCLSA